MEPYLRQATREFVLKLLPDAAVDDKDQPREYFVAFHSLPFVDRCVCVYVCVCVCVCLQNLFLFGAISFHSLPFVDRCVCLQICFEVCVCVCVCVCVWVGGFRSLCDLIGVSK